MTPEDWLALVIVLICLLLSAFFSGSETALTASSRATMHRLEMHGNRRAAIVNRLLDARERMIGALLFGNNAANIAASALATGVLLAWFGDVGVIYATVVMTIVVVVFAEVLPKTAALNAPDRVSLRVARAVDLAVRLLGPVLVGVEALVKWLLRLVGIKAGEDLSLLSPHEELRGAVDLLHSEGGVEKHTRDMFSGLLDLRELVVSDVMIHLTAILAEMVGDTTDEQSVVVPGVRPQPDGSVNVDGGVPIRDLNRAMDWNLPDEEATTVAGLVIHEARSIPEPGQSFTFHGFRFQVLRRDRNRITGLRITPLGRRPQQPARAL